MQNTLTVTGAPLVINGQTVQSGLGLNVNLGPSPASMFPQISGFLAQQNAQAQGFEQAAIGSTQAFFQGQVQPITSAIANATNQSAAAASSALPAILAPYQAGGAPASGAANPLSGGLISNLISSFKSLMGGLANTQAAVSANSLAAIESNNQASIASSNASASKGSGGGCFITTAVCELEGKPDDCAELQTLREYRDGWLAKQPGGPEEIQVYYMVAPRILAAIRARTDSLAVLLNLRDQVHAAVELVRAGRMEDARRAYRAMVENAAACYLGENCHG